MRLVAQITPLHAGGAGGYVYAIGGGHRLLLGVFIDSKEARKALRDAARVGVDLREIIEDVREETLDNRRLGGYR